MRFKAMVNKLSVLFSDLNLNSDTPVRVQPVVGEWGPQRVPTTKQKKRARFTVTGVFAAVVTALFLLGNYFYKILMGITG
ncbi:hypothetical protein [Propionimicrobium sp. PCR01-08-3]|uniref:hypothetical protein n=1 Tax=Propionimicrobium sp. PCR01-08-3 TaxID=3052086 RepID=UPI00255CB3FE|nr:hypothetical protein [Propionimicrobium sp. PCR01-08-3]WIY83843.1 hypothetical protein QQ658_05720 [Propionimicrobium sp. PCR01-08-3]